MKRRRMGERRRFLIGCLFGCVLILSAASSLAAEKKAPDVDALYAQAAAAARNGERAEARRLAVEVLVVAPGYADATGPHRAG